MITTHVLDIGQGRPGVAVDVTLEIEQTGRWHLVGRGVTDAKGRLATLTNAAPVVRGTYRLRFDLAAYYRNQGMTTPFFPAAEVTFNVADGTDDYHVPLLISPYGYSTYRGA